jgi:hypothetical protein
MKKDVLSLQHSAAMLTHRLKEDWTINDVLRQCSTIPICFFAPAGRARLAWVPPGVGEATPTPILSPTPLVVVNGCPQYDDWKIFVSGQLWSYSRNWCTG